MQPSHEDRPTFAVLDIVVSLLPDERRAEGVVYSVRRYVDGHYAFSVSALDPDDEVTGGIYAGRQLAATGRCADVSLFWTKPDWARRIVTVSEDYPGMKLRGSFGLVRDELEAGEVYSVEFMSAKGWKHKTKRRDIAARFLEPTEHRLRPEPVPRPIRTFRTGHGERNVWPAHEFEITDELDQYL